MIRRKSAGDFRLGLPDRRIIEMLLVGPLPDLGDLSVVDLDLVVDLVGGKGGPARQRGDKRDDAELQFQTPDHL